MIEQNNSEKETVENVQQTPLENEAASDGNANEAQIPVISDPSQVEPITSVELFERALLLLHSGADDENNKPYIDCLYTIHFGENYTPEDMNSPLSDERQLNVVTEYIRDRLDYTKTMSTCLNKQKIDKSFEDIFSLVGMNISVSNSVEEIYDEVFARRAGANAFLLQDYEVLKLNRQMWHIYNNEVNITELSGLITTMEDLEICVDDNKDAQNFKIVSKEHLAQFYYNASEIYDNEANSKSNMPDINRWHYRAMEYKKKALDTTSGNILMVANIQNEWKDYTDYDPQKIEEACERIIGNDTISDRDKFRAHKLYAQTLFNKRRFNGFSHNEDYIDNAIKHFRCALAYVGNRDDKINILNHISQAQKINRPQDFVTTRLKIAEILEGRPRIREYLKISDFTKDNKVKALLLKSCINEFHELDEIDIEDRNLYDDIDLKLRKITPDEDVKTLKTLDKLKKKYGTKQDKTGELLFPMISSKGHDYFN